MRYLSVCSGIEAASCAWPDWTPVAFSEIEPFPCAVLAHHYPNTPNYGDMTQFKEWPDANVDVLVGGTPCQSFSVAGLRKGLDDPRGNLMLTYLAIAHKYRPRWLVWENVPGVLSSNGGRDFATFLRGLAELGYGFAYRVLDAQFFGVAQRRRRVFVVGCLGDWRRAAAVLFERHSLSGHPAPRREAGKEVAGTFTARAKSGGWGQDPNLAAGGYMQPVPHADISPAIKARDSKGVSSDGDGDGAILVPMVAHSLRAEGFDASEDGSGRGTPLVPIAIQGTMIGRSESAGPAGPAGRGWSDDGLSFTLTKTDQHAIAFDCKASGQNGFGVGEIASTLRGMGHANSHQNGGGHQAVAFEPGSIARNAGPSGTSETVSTLRADMGDNQPAVMTSMQVRRLTPRECERLQGFPDDYTLIPIKKLQPVEGQPTVIKMAADGPRYKALGNSMAVPVMAWIGKRIQMASEL